MGPGGGAAVTSGAAVPSAHAEAYTPESEQRRDRIGQQKDPVQEHNGEYGRNLSPTRVPRGAPIKPRAWLPGGAYRTETSFRLAQTGVNGRDKAKVLYFGQGVAARASSRGTGIGDWDAGPPGSALAMCSTAPAKIGLSFLLPGRLVVKAVCAGRDHADGPALAQSLPAEISADQRTNAVDPKESTRPPAVGGQCGPQRDTGGRRRRSGCPGADNRPPAQRRKRRR